MPENAAPKKASAKKTASVQSTAKKAAPKKAAPKKAAPKKAAPKKAAPKKAAPGPRPSAGSRILSDLGITDAELAAFLPPDAPKWIRSVLWCQFDRPGTLEDIAAHFQNHARSGTLDVEIVNTSRTPPEFPDGLTLRAVSMFPKGRYARAEILGMRGETYVEDGRWQLEFTVFSSGTPWGSNRALYERFKALELPALGATNVEERTD